MTHSNTCTSSMTHSDTHIIINTLPYTHIIITDTWHINVHTYHQWHTHLHTQHHVWHTHVHTHHQWHTYTQLMTSMTHHIHTQTPSTTHIQTHTINDTQVHMHTTHTCVLECVCVCACVCLCETVGLQVCVNVLLKKEHHDCSHIVQFKIIQSESNGGIHVLKVVCILWYGFVLCPCIHWDLLCTFSVWTNNVMFLNKVFCMSCMHASAQIGMPERVWVLWRQTQEQCDHLGQPLCWQPLDVECSCHRLLHPLLDFPSRLWHLLFNLPADIWDLLQQAEKLPHCTLLQCWNERTIALDDAPNEPKPGSCQDTKINSYKCKEQHFHPST